MQIKKASFTKLLLVAITGLTLSAAPSTASFARENEATKPTTTGVASWYGDNFHGKKTANGDTYNQKKLTCASNHYALGTWLRVTNLRTGKAVIVQVNDRMHPRIKRVVDLSRAAARQIGIEKSGTGKVKIEDLGK